MPGLTILGISSSRLNLAANDGLSVQGQNRMMGGLPQGMESTFYFYDYYGSLV